MRPEDTGDRSDAAQTGEGPLGTEPGGVVPGGDEQLPCCVRAHAWEGRQPRGDSGDQWRELGVEVVNLLL